MIRMVTDLMVPVGRSEAFPILVSSSGICCFFGRPRQKRTRKKRYQASGLRFQRVKPLIPDRWTPDSIQTSNIKLKPGRLFQLVWVRERVVTLSQVVGGHWVVNA